MNFENCREDEDSNKSRDGHQDCDEDFLEYFLNVSEHAKSWMPGTPRHFTLFAKTFLKIKEEKETFILNNERKFKVLELSLLVRFDFFKPRVTLSFAFIVLQAGLSKLTETKEVVARLKEDAAQQESKLAEKQSKANAALELITKTMQNASSQKTEMESLKGTIEKESVALSIR